MLSRKIFIMMNKILHNSNTTLMKKIWRLILCQKTHLRIQVILLTLLIQLILRIQLIQATQQMLQTARMKHQRIQRISHLNMMNQTAIKLAMAAYAAIHKYMANKIISNKTHNNKYNIIIIIFIGDICLVRW